MAFLSDEEGEWLVRTARAAVESHFDGRKMAPDPPTEKLRAKAGVFTTIRKHGQLRGCIGYPEPIKPLHIAVGETALLAAFEDPRFPPLKREELDEVTFEVSVLTPPEPLDCPAEERPEHVVVGKHGLIVRYGPYSGLLLPQVPVEEGWDATTFLSYCCIKAGLPPEAWLRDDVHVYTFEAEVFEEETPRGKVRRVPLTVCR